MTITNLVGDVCKSKVEGLKILPHICNSSGIASSGVIVPIFRKFPNARTVYNDWYDTTQHYCEFTEEEIPWLLGETQFVESDDEWIVANMLAQKSPGLYQRINGKTYPPIRLEALAECMNRVADVARKLKASIVTPLFGTLRAGSSKEVIVPMIEDIWADLDVYIYEFDESKK